MPTAPDLHDACMEPGARARREGKVIDLAIYRGSALIDHARKLREQGESPAQVAQLLKVSRQTLARALRI